MQSPPLPASWLWIERRVCLVVASGGWWGIQDQFQWSQEPVIEPGIEAGIWGIDALVQSLGIWQGSPLGWMGGCREHARVMGTEA